MARVEGIDVSQFQGTVNWSTVYNSGKRFAFVRASRTNLDLDPNLNANMTNAKAAGVLVGPYHRVLPQGVDELGPYTDPLVDAQRFVNAAGAYMSNGYLRPVVDVEDGETLGKAALSQWVVSFVNEVKRLKPGANPLIYCNTNFASNYLDATVVAAAPDLWIANWNTTAYGDPVTGTGGPPTGVWGANGQTWDFWQYSSTGDGPSIGTGSTYVDLDVFNGSDVEVLKQNFLIGYAPPPAPGTIGGSLFHDSNGNGALNTGEPLLAGRTVYIDADNDAVRDAGETSATTDSAGKYTFSVNPGTYVVRQAVPSGWYQTVPANNGARTATVTSGATTTLFAFGSAQFASVSGSVFNDANGNGVRNTGEAGLSAWTVYIDADNDGVRDAGELIATSDANGNWSFTGLKTGTYNIRVVQKAGYTLTTPTGGKFTHTLASGTAITGDLFGQR
jgi:GH25 family lysozyme M1 (1,4-beta-N-acetylmuramidase)/uncharacterized protein (DUF2141 family)